MVALVVWLLPSAASASAKPARTVIDLGTLGGGFSHAYLLNDRGQVVGAGTTAGGDWHASSWTDGVLTDIGTLGGRESYISIENGLNNRGQIVGWSQLPSGHFHAFLREDGRLADLGTLGGRASSARAINEHGDVAGSAQTDAGAWHATVWMR
jgi:probable HAF family extracellular repeat protein